MREATRSTTWTWMNLGMLLFAAVVAIWPTFRPAVAIFGLVLIPAYFVGFLRRTELGGVPLNEVRAQAKARRRLPRSPVLELAVAVATLLAAVSVNVRA